MEADEGSKSFRRVLTACFLIACCLAAFGETADTTGELHGVVVDAGGVGLSNVRVALSSEVLIGGVHERTNIPSTT